MGSHRNYWDGPEIRRGAVSSHTAGGRVGTGAGSSFGGREVSPLLDAPVRYKLKEGPVSEVVCFSPLLSTGVL